MATSRNLLEERSCNSNKMQCNYPVVCTRPGTEHQDPSTASGKKSSTSPGGVPGVP